MRTKITRREAKKIGSSLGMDWRKYKLSEFVKGVNVELEHEVVTGGDLLQTGMIAKDHLDEVPNYYTLLERYVEG